MITRVMIIGGYGNFGSYISKALALENNIQVIIGGRSLDKANRLVKGLRVENPVETVFLDIQTNLSAVLSTVNPDVVIHTSGPFQHQDYKVAMACIGHGCHYIDIADAREFVEGIESLHEISQQKNVLVISGASSIPCFTAALLDDYECQFAILETLNYGITTAQKTRRGLATTAAILGYTGQAFKTIKAGKQVMVYGWQGLHARKYKNLGWRLMGYCNVPDLSLFPRRYSRLKSINFYAGLEVPFIHITLWLLSWLVRIEVIKNLEKYAPSLLRLSLLFDWLGSNNSGFHMDVRGIDSRQQKKSLSFELVARSGDGPYIPCMPAILLAKKIANREITTTGAYPCMGFISKGEYLGALSELDITWEESEQPGSPCRQ